MGILIRSAAGAEKIAPHGIDSAWIRTAGGADKLWAGGLRLGSLPLGATIKFGLHQVNAETPWPIVWRVVAHNHRSVPAYPADSVTLITDRIVDLRCVDAAEPLCTVTLRKNGGNNRYSQSNIDRWLGSAAAAGAWYAPAHATDQPPDSASVCFNGTAYAARPGFLHRFTAAERALLLPTTIRILPNPAYDDGIASEDIVRRVFLPSMSEVGKATEENEPPYPWPGLSASDSARSCLLAQPVFDNTLSDQKPSTADVAWVWWGRTQRRDSPNSLCTISASGKALSDAARRGKVGVRPAINLSAGTPLTPQPDASGCYSIV